MNLIEKKTLSRIQKEKRSTIKKAALEVFSEYGLRGATLDKIAVASGLTKPNILYYYSSKDQIYFDVLSGLLDEWVAPLHNISSDGDPIDELLGYMKAKLKMSKQKPQESKLFATEILHGAPLTQNVLATSLKQTLDEKVEILEQENLRLEAINKSLEKLSIDFNKINSLWSSASIDKDRFLISKKNFLSSNEYQPLLVLDINQGKNITINDAVLSEQGLVGRINNLGFLSAEVMLVQDVRSSIPIVSGESSLHASLSGMGLGRKGELKFIKKTARFLEGEKIYTSGLGEVFPEGLLVGEVVSISDPVDSEFLKIEVSCSSTPINRDYFLIHAK